MAAPRRRLILDAGPLIGILRSEPGAPAIVAALAREEQIALSVANLAETVDVLRRVHGIAADDVDAAVARFLSDDIELLPVTTDIALRAADLRARHYHRSRADVSLADCFAVASASPADAIATADPPLVRICRAEGVGVVLLPDSHGITPA